jgi:hypothetical protein
LPWFHQQCSKLLMPQKEVRAELEWSHFLRSPTVPLTLPSW